MKWSNTVKEESSLIAIKTRSNFHNLKKHFADVRLIKINKLMNK